MHRRPAHGWLLTRLVVVIAGVVVPLLGGCGATRHPTVGVPGDFALGVTVLGSRVDADAPRGQRPAQYLLESDGAYRVGVGAGVEASTYPPMTRRLTPGQVERLWTLSEAAGLTTFPHPKRLDDVQGFRPTPRDGWAVIDIAADGKRQAIAVRLDEEPAVAGLADELAGLAWIRP